MGFGIFITAIIVVSIICLCFFKKRFWENRYLVLFISGCVAIVATLTVNYATRNNLDKEVRTIWTQSIQVMSLNDSLVDSTSFLTLNKEVRFGDHFANTGDSTKVPIYSRHMFYYNSDGNLRVGYAQEDDLESKGFNEVYFASSENDTIAYLAKLRYDYTPNPNKWVADFSLPHIKTIRCFYLPPNEYATIPDSLIRELPF